MSQFSDVKPCPQCHGAGVLLTEEARRWIRPPGGYAKYPTCPTCDGRRIVPVDKEPS